jgi:flagellar hook-basal body complex protein FliE
MKIDSASLMQMRAQILQQNSALQKAAGIDGGAAVTGPGATAPASGAFGEAMRTALDEVNTLQTKSSAASEAYERGETTDIAAVMLAREQASIGFQATLQVRNKLLAAYKDIMSMPV